MSLKCLVIGDTTSKNQKVSRLLDSNKIEIFRWDGLALNLNSATLSDTLDLVIIIIDSYDQTILATEEISRSLPNIFSILLLDSSKTFPWMFMTTMKAMVSRVIFNENIDDLAIIIDEIYHLKYHVVKKTTCNSTFTQREMNIIHLIQINLAGNEICQRLSISKKTLTRHVVDCGAKLGCSGRGSIGTESFRVFGDLSEELK